MLNQARLKTLKVREDHVGEVLNEARKRLVKVTSDPELYREVLKKLILQAILQVSKIKLWCRQLKNSSRANKYFLDQYFNHLAF